MEKAALPSSPARHIHHLPASLSSTSSPVRCPCSFSPSQRACRGAFPSFQALLHNSEGRGTGEGCWVPPSPEMPERGHNCTVEHRQGRALPPACPSLAEQPGLERDHGKLKNVCLHILGLINSIVKISALV